MIASVIANANRDPKRSRRAYEPQDFIPQWGGKKRELPPQAVADKVKAAFQGIIAKGRG